MTQDKELCFLWDNTIHGAIPAFEKFEAAFAFEKVFEHPYCPEEVDLKAYILKPNGDQKQISGFWYEGFQRVLRNGREILISTSCARTPKGNTPRWAGALMPEPSTKW